MQSFKDKIAVITGAASGVGRGTALALAREGAHIVVADLNAPRMAETVEHIKSLGVEAIAVRCDVSRDEDVRGLRDAAIARFGRVHILMNNAGTLPVGAFEATPVSEWERTLQVNLLSVVRGVQIFLPDLLAAGEAHIVNTASLAGLLAYDPLTLAYNASKAALISLSEGLALALAPRHIGVTCLCPGPVATNIGEHVHAHGDIAGLGVYARRAFASRTPDEVGEMVVAAIREQRFLLPTNGEVFSVLKQRGADPDGFLRDMARFLEQARGPQD